MEKLAKLGKTFGSAEVLEKADQANRNPPQIKPFDRYGNRINQVEYHPVYHELMSLASATRSRTLPGIILCLEGNRFMPPSHTCSASLKEE